MLEHDEMTRSKRPRTVDDQDDESFADEAKNINSGLQYELLAVDERLSEPSREYVFETIIPCRSVTLAGRAGVRSAVYPAVRNLLLSYYWLWR